LPFCAFFLQIKIVMSFKSIFWFCFVLLFSCSKNRTVSENQLQNGDFVFVEAKQENLSGAINRVTQKTKTENFDHIGLIEIESDSVFVLHASADLGSNRQPFEYFCTENVENDKKMVVYRLRKQYQKAILPAISQSKKMLGKPYNWTYVLDENSYYCSDFIERIFRKDSIFEHIPMNFENPKTGKTDDFWMDFYQKLNLDVPQNLPGTNPNQLAKSEKLIRMGELLLSD